MFKKKAALNVWQ